MSLVRSLSVACDVVDEQAWTKNAAAVCTNWLRAKRVYADDEIVEAGMESDVTTIAEYSCSSRCPQRNSRRSVRRSFGALRSKWLLSILPANPDKKFDWLYYDCDCS